LTPERASSELPSLRSPEGTYFGVLERSEDR
jgi:hypothetical protein